MIAIGIVAASAGETRSGSMSEASRARAVRHRPKPVGQGQEME